MSASLIDGTTHAARLRGAIAHAVADLASRSDGVPGLAVVLVGDDPASQVYVRAKKRLTVEAGMRSFEHALPHATTEADLLALVTRLNADPAVDGILVQLPLPAGIEPAKVIAAIDPAKDVDGFHPANAGGLAVGDPAALVPCTPLGSLMLLRAVCGDLAGAEAVVVGRSNIVGRPMAQLLIGESCTVTVAHSRTHDLPAVCRRADILVAAVGRPEMIRGDWLRPGATVIDVGINRVTGAEGASRLVGDVAFAEAAEVAGAITPVPGGVGPMTIACLLLNTLTAACRRRNLPRPVLAEV